MAQRILVVFFAILINFCVIGNSGATHFEIGHNGNFKLSKIWGFGDIDYSYQALSRTFDLAEGQTSAPIDFFSVTFHSFFLGSGEAEVKIDFLQPFGKKSGNVGRYCGISFWGRFLGGEISWGDPTVIGYGNGGSLLLDLNDLGGIKCGSTIMISGTISHMNGSLPIREPATMIMIGTGIIGLAGLGRKKIFKSEKR